jgi:hypothetical protein
MDTSLLIEVGNLQVGLGATVARYTRALSGEIAIEEFSRCWRR